MTFDMRCPSCGHIMAWDFWAGAFVCVYKANH